jgi:hypothetical protein
MRPAAVTLPIGQSSLSVHGLIQLKITTSVKDTASGVACGLRVIAATDIPLLISCNAQETLKRHCFALLAGSAMETRGLATCDVVPEAYA